jgi:anti-sigma factor RsiW
MSEHLSADALNRFADGELGSDQVAGVEEHLAACCACTSNGLSQMVLKATTARAGRRYEMPAELRERLLQTASQEAPKIEAQKIQHSGGIAAEARRGWRSGWLGWAAAAALLLVSLSGVLLERSAMNRASEVALVTEVYDQHIATLAANRDPQVLSSDRHTVKPWFQGRIPFTFNLPDGLAEDTKLDGANLAYLDNRPVAQLLYSIGKHRVSVFVRERGGAGGRREATTERSGFHVASASTAELELVAVSDVDAGRLRSLVAAIAQAQGA